MRKWMFLTSVVWLGGSAAAGPVPPLFSTGSADGLLGSLSRPGATGVLETETADDFILGQEALISGATFVGLLPSGALVSTISDVEIELYHVFPVDSNTGRTPNVPTRTNSPSDNQFASFDQTAGDIAVTPSVLNPDFTVLNSVVNGIHPKPSQFTGGEGAVTGEEVLFSIVFNHPFLVGATDHDFFRPEVGLSSGNFLWLSAPRPGPIFTGDLQAWARNANLSPDWLRIGTDIIDSPTSSTTYNMTFSLSGTPVPEPGSMLLLGAGLAAVAGWRRRIADQLRKYVR